MKIGDILKNNFKHIDSHQIKRGHVQGSKYYIPTKSFTHSEVWWFDIPLKEINMLFPNHIHLLCQKDISSKDFYHIKVPKSVLIEAINNRVVEITPKSKVRLHLSARQMDKFLDIRTKNSYPLNLSEFLQ
jgi:hypothetical protein